MQLRTILTEEDAVSPVIGVILMVAVTVILAAVIGAFVLNIGETEESPPQNQFTWDFNDPRQEVTVSHGGGVVLDATRLSLSGPWAGGDCQVVNRTSVTAGEVIVNNSTGADYCSHTGADGETLEIVWTSSNGAQSQIISKKPIP